MRELYCRLDRGERGVEDSNARVEIRGRDHERRRERQHVALAHLERQAARQAFVHDLLGLALARGRRSRASSMPSRSPMPRTSATSGCCRLQRAHAARAPLRPASAPARAAARSRSLRASRAPRRSRRGSFRACNGRARGRRRRRGRGVRSAPPSETRRRPVPCPAPPCRERCRSARTRTSGPVRPRQIGISSRISSAPWRSQASRMIR